MQGRPSDEAAIDTLLERLAAAAVAADAEVYAALYDENGALMPPNEVAAVGRAAIRDWAEDFFARWELQVDTFMVDDRRIGSSVGFARYRVVGSYIPKAGGPAVPFDQKYVDTYVKDATGSWTLAAHIANSNTKAQTIWN